MKSSTCSAAAWWISTGNVSTQQPASGNPAAGCFFQFRLYKAVFQTLPAASSSEEAVSTSTPRALARNGHIDTAWRFFIQHSYPGWMHRLDSGATTLLENWERSQSWNHIMYGDFVAFAFEYPGGIRLTPGFAAGGPLRVAPCIPAELDSFQVRCRTGRGEVECRWCRHGGRLEFELALPAAVEAELTLCGRQFRQGPGKQRYTVSQAD